LIRFRTFRNSDPPRLLQAYRQPGLGRAFARPESVHALEVSVFGLPYFDPRGFILAEDDETGRLAGFIHAGFGFTPDLNAIDHSRGVICCVRVAGDSRRQGIGRELVHRAEDYLEQSGATSIQAGQTKYVDPFYFGIYGGARPSGFPLSEPSSDPFFRSLGYVPFQRIQIYQRDLKFSRDPVNVRLVSHRRHTELVVSDQPKHPTWWWLTHFGNIESMRFSLIERKSGNHIASLTVVGLDHYIAAWGERAIGLVDILVEEKFRGQGYGQTLIIETLRRLRTELITRAEIHIPDGNPHAVQAVTNAGFDLIDIGIVYSKGSSFPPPGTWAGSVSD